MSTRFFVTERHGPRWRLVSPDGRPAGRRDLLDLAGAYYRVMHDAIRRCDPNHLILGDRYELLAPLPEEVIQAAGPYVDAFSFQHFGRPEEIQRDLARMAEQTGKPVLLADSAQFLPAQEGDFYKRHDGAGYARTLALLREVPACVGFHFCGAYLRNDARRYGLRDLRDEPCEPALDAIREANAQMRRWAEGDQAANA